MAAISTAFKRNRHLGPQNEPVMVYFGTFGPMPLAAGNYHLWDMPPRVRIVDGYIEVDTAAGSAAAALLGIILNTSIIAPIAAESIFVAGAITAGTAVHLRFIATSVRVAVPNDANRYVMVYNREAAVTGNGETFTVCLLAIRDDLS